jgi:hypothetical protein
MRLLACFVLIVCAHFCLAESVVARARIVEITESGFVLGVGTESMSTQVEKTTRYWRDMTPAKKLDFLPGDSVMVRINEATTPASVREVADIASGEALAAIRKETLSCTVLKVDLKTVLVQMEGRIEFAYRYTEKSKLEIGGMAAHFGELKKGQRLFIKGRFLSSLDTWIVSASDVKPKDESPQKSRSTIPSSVKIQGVVDLHQPPFSMVDLYIDERLVHVIYTPRTVVKLEGSKTSFAAIERGLWARILVRRDQFGRLIASQIELFHGKRS